MTVLCYTAGGGLFLISFWWSGVKSGVKIPQMPCISAFYESSILFGSTNPHISVNAVCTV